ncbi:hypothetical protein F3Y22_tig00110429pilonHSYRG00268 [Hibiscus syriacus]|uniref:RNase H type-1 domain-containing protein n=1 Tax=Hibiscus syriacus TaxID=106335 RepID=A0A6A3AQY3_HIBSY|nr:hypothetical protein F3Y22_tig00110429pilonHSYRG00268 [Hibiscus syriacus]
MIFKNSILDENQLYDLALFRVSSRCKNHWPDSFKSIFYVLLCPLEAYIFEVCRFKPLASAWYPPPKELLKFNVDGAVWGSFGLAGIGGILRDHKGNILDKFSKVAGLLDPSSAELQAILAVCRRLQGSARFSSYRLII